MGQTLRRLLGLQRNIEDYTVGVVIAAIQGARAHSQSVVEDKGIAGAEEDLDEHGNVTHRKAAQGWGGPQRLGT
jgi:hypothetical protein